MAAPQVNDQPASDAGTKDKDGKPRMNALGINAIKYRKRAGEGDKRPQNRRRRFRESVYTRFPESVYFHDVAGDTAGDLRGGEGFDGMGLEAGDTLGGFDDKGDLGFLGT